MQRCVERISPQRLEAAKIAFTLRRVPPSALVTIISGELVPSAGDLVLAKVKQVGQHAHLQLVSGRKTVLFSNDEIIVCYGNRYAVDQFEAYVPDSLIACHLAAGGGIAAAIRSQHSQMSSATTIEPQGLIGDELGKPLNVMQFALPLRGFEKTPTP